MKNKNIMLLLGIYGAYLLYKYLNKPTLTSNQFMPTKPILNEGNLQLMDTNNIPNMFLVDKVKTAEIPDTNAPTYQTYYGSMAGNGYKVPSTC